MTKTQIWYIFLIYLKEKFEDTREVVRSHKSRRTDDTMTIKKEQKTNNNLQNTTQKTNDRAT
jgi:hypothetical protein